MVADDVSRKVLAAVANPLERLDLPVVERESQQRRVRSGMSKHLCHSDEPILAKSARELDAEALRGKLSYAMRRSDGHGAIAQAEA